MIRLIRPLIQKSSSSISVVSLITLSGSTKVGNSPDLISLYPIIGSSHLAQYLRETGVDGSPEKLWLQRDDKPEKAEKYYKKALELYWRQRYLSYQSWVRFERQTKRQ